MFRNGFQKNCSYWLSQGLRLDWQPGASSFLKTGLQWSFCSHWEQTLIAKCFSLDVCKSANRMLLYSSTRCNGKIQCKYNTEFRQYSQGFGLVECVSCHCQTEWAYSDGNLWRWTCIIFLVGSVHCLRRLYIVETYSMKIGIWYYLNYKYCKCFLGTFWISRKCCWLCSRIRASDCFNHIQGLNISLEVYSSSSFISSNKMQLSNVVWMSGVFLISSVGCI